MGILVVIHSHASCLRVYSYGNRLQADMHLKKHMIVCFAIACICALYIFLNLPVWVCFAFACVADVRVVCSARMLGGSVSCVGCVFDCVHV